jgi:hypothetical protein
MITPSDGWSVVPNDCSVVYEGDVSVVSPLGRTISVHTRIVEWTGLAAEVFVHDPPRIMREHPHGHCLQLLSPPAQRWFTLHFTHPPLDAESARIYVHQMLAEASQRST